MCLCHELSLRCIPFQQHIPVPLVYKGASLGAGYELDLIVDQKIILEIKSVAALSPVHEAQLLTYLRLMNLRVGMLLNFNCPVMKDGIVRRVR